MVCVPQVVISSEERKKSVLKIGALVATVGGVVVAVLVVAITLWVQRVNEQKKLQSELASAVNANDNREVVTVATQLIDGQKARKYSVNNHDLAIDYLDRASSHLNLKQYPEAVPDFQEATKLDGSDKQAALQGEINARYMLGERKELVPLLQQLIDAIKHDPDPMNVTPEQYEGAIKAIQNNQEPDL